MDVKKVLIAICSIFFLTACGGDDNNSGNFTKADSDCANQAIQNEKIVKWKSGKISRVLFKKDHPKALRKYLEKHKKDIDFVEDNYRVHIPEDTSSLVSSMMTGGYVGDEHWGVKNIRAENVWNQNKRGENIIVAVIDSGIDDTHPELSTQLYTNPNEIPGNNKDDDGNGFIDDVHGYDFTKNSGNLYDSTGHGTHVAGIIAANHEVGKAVGVAPKAKILALDFFDDTGGGSVFDAIKAMNYAAQAGARVVNASWGGQGCSLALKQAIDNLGQQNILFVTAAGNSGKNIDFIPSYPAAFDSSTQITVGASTFENYTAGFSNFGNKVHLVAPGAHIFSTIPGYYNDDGELITHRFDNGTSMAAPFVSGAAALLLSAFPQATPVDIKQALMSSVKAGPFPVETRGRLDVASAYEFLKNKFGTPLP